MNAIERDERDELLIKVRGQFAGIDLVSYLDAKAIVDDLRRQLAEVTKERDELKRDRATRFCDVERIKEWWHSHPRKNSALAFTCGPERSIAIGMEMLADERDQAREQLATAEAEAAAMRKNAETLSKVTSGIGLVSDKEVAIRLHEWWYRKGGMHWFLSVRDATAGRDLLDEMKNLEKENADLTWVFSESIKKLAVCTAITNGCPTPSLIERCKVAVEIIERNAREIAAKDERIAELESQPLASPQNVKATGEILVALSGALRRSERKCRTAKAALVEARERIAELERECAGLADKAYDEAEPVEMTDAEIDNIVAKVTQEPKPEPVYWTYDGSARWFIDDGKVFCEPTNGIGARITSGLENGNFEKIGMYRCNADGSPLVKPEPVWQYRRAGMAMYRTCDGKMIEFKTGNRGWVKSVGMNDWQRLLLDDDTYPCDEHGQRIKAAKSFGQEIVDSLQSFSDKLASGEEIRSELSKIEKGGACCSE
jgi:hypothetical protein